jgi:thymidylate kinase
MNTVDSSLNQKKTDLPSAGSTDFPRLIAFFGPDGAGKSTQADLLISYLNGNGFKVKKAWVRSTHTVAFLLWIVFKKLNLVRGQSKAAKQMTIRPAVSYLNQRSYGAVSPITTSPPVLKGSLSKFIWSTIEVIGILPVVLLQVYLPLMLGYEVVAERYVADSVASIAYFLNDENFADSLNGKLLLKLIPKRTMFVYVDADYQAILNRRAEAAGPVEYTEFHRRVFSKVASTLNARYVNTGKLDVDQASAKIIGFLQKDL